MCMVLDDKDKEPIVDKQVFKQADWTDIHGNFCQKEMLPHMP